MDDLCRLSASDLLDGYRRRNFSPVEVIDALAERIEAVDLAVEAFPTLRLDEARAEAQTWAQRYARGVVAEPLGGIPFAVKDLFDTAGVRTTYGSPLFADHVPGADAEAVRRIKAAGGILLGKTQTHEFAWGITSVNPRMGTSRNPWSPQRISGGSSGGSAVALAADEIPLALASERGARSESRPRSAALSASSRPTGASAPRARSRSRARSTIPDR